MSIVVRTKTPPLNLVEPLRAELRGAAGDERLYQPRSMEQLASASVSEQRFLRALFAAFAGTALLLAAMGTGVPDGAARSRDRSADGAGSDGS